MGTRSLSSRPADRGRALPPRWLRALLRAPAVLYRWRLGWFLGRRFMLVTHRGRRTGAVRRSVLEVARYDPVTREAIVISAWGEHAAWYRNLLAAPAIEVALGDRRYVPAQRVLDTDEIATVIGEYARRHPLAARVAPWILGGPVAGPEDVVRRTVARLRAVAFRPRS